MIHKRLFKTISVGGKIFKYNGYENHAINYLHNTLKIPVCEIEVEKVPNIVYVHNSIIRRYYPDIYITSLDLLIEVKSWYTLLIDINKNLDKFKFTIDKYNNIQLLVFNKYGNLEYKILLNQDNINIFEKNIIGLPVY